MCIGLLIASEKPLPYWEYELASRHISVSEVQREVSRYRRFFSKPYIYGVASYTGDGCGFGHENLEGQQGRDALAALLERALVREPEIELFVDYFDATTPGVEPSSHDFIGPSDIRTWRSSYLPGEFLMVIREA